MNKNRTQKRERVKCVDHSSRYVEMVKNVSGFHFGFHFGLDMFRIRSMDKYNYNNRDFRHQTVAISGSKSKEVLYYIFLFCEIHLASEAGLKDNYINEDFKSQIVGMFYHFIYFSFLIYV